MPRQTRDPDPDPAGDDGLSTEELASRRALRRAQDRRRRRRLIVTVGAPAVLAMAVVTALVLSARGGAPETGPATAAGPVPAATLTTAQPSPSVVLARIGRLALRLPVPRQQVTAVLFHPTGAPGAVPLTPEGGLEHKVAPAEGRPGPETAAVDVGAPAGAPVYAPVDGIVTAVIPYRVLGRQEGLEIAITPTALTDVVVRLAHVEPMPDGLVPEVGQGVAAGRGRPLGRVRDFSAVAEQELARYTADAGNHVSLEVVRQASAPSVP